MLEKRAARFGIQIEDPLKTRAKRFGLDSEEKPLTTSNIDIEYQKQKKSKSEASPVDKETALLVNDEAFQRRAERFGVNVRQNAEVAKSLSDSLSSSKKQGKGNKAQTPAKGQVSKNNNKAKPSPKKSSTPVVTADPEEEARKAARLARFAANN